MTELLLCPFCGESKELTKSESFVNCESCLCQALKMRWNSRHSPWISVKDGLPSIDRKVLMFTDNKEVLIGILTHFGFFEIRKTDDICVTHWMQLPNKPKETE